MKTGPTTIKDIARKLNISPSTVSRALRNHPDISAETKNNVATLVEELDYHPNLIAASLQKRKTNTIGIIVPEIRHDFFSTVISGIEDVSYQADYTIMVCQSNEDSDKESKIIKALVSNRVDGLMISISQNTLDPAPFLSLKRQNVPFVFFDRIFDDINVSKVIVNDFESAEQAVEHLILRGYKRIAHLAGPEYISISKDRLQGYKSTLKKHGIPYQEELVIHGGFSEDDWRWVPRLVMKPGEETFWLPNYFIEMWGDRRMFSCGYNVQGQYLWPQVNSPDNTLVPGSWFHLTFIRDTSRNILLQITHDANRELVVFNVAEYDPITGNLPTQTSMPFHIGFGGGGADSWLDGFVDEIRISDVVREVPIPPIITEVTELENQLASVGSYEINANITTLFPSTTVQSATLHYNVGSGWQELPMAAAGDVYSASISGQPLGSVIKYYLSAVADNGLRAVMPVTAEGEDPFYYSFGVYAPNTQTLDLTFEEGTGTVIDHSDYGQAVTMVGKSPLPAMRQSVITAFTLRVIRVIWKWIRRYWLVRSIQLTFG